MEEHNRYGEHIDKEELKYWLENNGEIVGDENEIICPHCGLIIDPNTRKSLTKPSETREDIGLFIDTGTKCPECGETYVIVSCVNGKYYYTSPDSTIWFIPS